MSRIRSEQWQAELQIALYAPLCHVCAHVSNTRRKNTRGHVHTRVCLTVFACYIIYIGGGGGGGRKVEREEKEFGVDIH